MEITFFLGAGISKPLGMPVVQDIHNILFNENYLFFVEDGEEKFSRIPRDKSKKTSGSDEIMQGIQNFLQGLQYCDEHYLKNIAPFKNKNGLIHYGSAYRKKNNYEILYYLCEQISLTSQGLTDNPMIAAFIEKITNQRFDDFFGIEKIIEVEKKSKIALKFIQWVVTSELGKSCDIEILNKELKIILEIMQSNHFDKVNIITFNHDILLEKLLSENKINFTDGFEKNAADIKNFIGFDEKADVKIIKPHGSVNWFPSIKNGENVSFKLSEKIERDYFGKDVYTDSEGVEFKFLKRYPNYLSGIGKIEKYNYDIFSDMMFEMHNVLNKNNLMIMSGYGWGDSAINGRLARWLDRVGNKMILLHKYPEELQNNSVYLDGNFDNLETSGKIISIKKWLCESSLNDIEMFF